MTEKKKTIKPTRRKKVLKKRPEELGLDMARSIIRRYGQNAQVQVVGFDDFTAVFMSEFLKGSGMYAKIIYGDTDLEKFQEMHHFLATQPYSGQRTVNISPHPEHVMTVHTPIVIVGKKGLTEKDFKGDAKEFFVIEEF